MLIGWLIDRILNMLFYEFEMGEYLDYSKWTYGMNFHII